MEITKSNNSLLLLHFSCLWSGWLTFEQCHSETSALWSFPASSTKTWFADTTFSYNYKTLTSQVHLSWLQEILPLSLPCYLPFNAGWQAGSLLAQELCILDHKCCNICCRVPNRHKFFSSSVVFKGIFALLCALVIYKKPHFFSNL